MSATDPNPPRRLLPARLPFFYGWLILPAAGIALFASGPGQTYTISIFVEPIIEETGWSRTLVSSLYTAGSLTAALAMMGVGRLLDRFGARVMLIAVGVVFGACLFGMSLVTQPLHLYLAFAAIRTLGQGSLTLIPTALISMWFVRLRGRATALASLGGVTSQAVLPPVIYFTMSNLGWRSTWIAMAFATWAILLPTAVVVRRSPESVGLLPDGAKTTEHHSDNIECDEKESDWYMSEALHTRAFWLLLFAGSSQSLITTALVFHQVSLFYTKGLDAELAAVTLTVMAGTAIVGTFVAGYLADRFPNRYVLAMGQVMLLAAMLWTFVIFEPWHALLYGGLLGIGMGLHITANTVIWPNYFGRKALGSIRGVAATSMVAFAAMGPLPFGILFDWTGNYNTSIAMFLMLPIACAVAGLMAYPPTKKRAC